MILILYYVVLRTTEYMITTTKSVAVRALLLSLSCIHLEVLVDMVSRGISSMDVGKFSEMLEYLL